MNQASAEKIREMFTNSLGIVNPGTLKFQRCHRLGQKKAGSNQPREITVKFLYYPDRELVWDRRKKFSGTNLYMNEDFPRRLADVDLNYIQPLNLPKKSTIKLRCRQTS